MRIMFDDYPNIDMNKEAISKHANLVLYNEVPEGFKIDKHTGSPLSGYDFYTDGKSILNGGKRILVKAHVSPINNIMPDPPLQYVSKKKGLKQDPMKDPVTRKKVNVLARNKNRYEENIDNRRLRTLSVLQKNSH